MFSIHHCDIKVRASYIESSVGSKHFVAIFKKSDIDISGCGISILDGSVIADFKFIFVHHCQSRGACLTPFRDLVHFPSFPWWLSTQLSPRLKPHHRRFASLSSPAQDGVGEIRHAQVISPQS
jgi:hypothetical protein